MDPGYAALPICVWNLCHLNRVSRLSRVNVVVREMPRPVDILNPLSRLNLFRRDVKALVFLLGGLDA